MHDAKDIDCEAVIERLLNEQRQLQTLLNEAKKELYSEKEFDGLTLVGGIRAVKKRYLDERARAEKLDKELDRLMRAGLIEKNRK